MSAVLQQPEAAVDQLPLIKPAPRPMVRHTVWGRLTRQAEVRVATDGSGQLIVQILQDDTGLSYVAMRHEPAGHMHELKEHAAHLRPGVAVLIVGIGFELRQFEGRQVLSPRICERIDLATFSFINADGSES